MTLTLTPGPPATTTDASETSARRPHRWLAVTTLLAGACLLVAAPIWKGVAAPALVKFPTNVDERPRYEGTFALFVDPATAAPLVEPTISDLAVDRHVEAVPSESGADRVVVRETIAFQVEGLADASQTHQYVMDRRTNANVLDPRAWAFEEANVVNRSGTFRIAMARDLDSTSQVTMYKDEIGGVYAAIGGPESEVVNGLHLVGFQASKTAEPLAEAYLRNLDAVVPLPRSLTFDQLKPSLIVAGVPVDETLATLTEMATPDDLAALAALVAEPIPLEYVDTFNGSTFVEPDTGAIVDVTSVVERVSVRPAPDAVPPLRRILERYQDEPAIADAIEGLDQLATQPLPVFEYRYVQTTASAEEIATSVADKRDLMRVVERTIPLILVTTGAVLAAIGVILVARQRRTRDSSTTT